MNETSTKCRRVLGMSLYFIYNEFQLRFCCEEGWKGGDHFKDLGLDWRVELQSPLRKCDGEWCNGLFWLTVPSYRWLTLLNA